MKEIVRSVKPYWFYLICEGIKKAEIGKSRPKAEDWNKVVHLYCSQDKKSFNRIPQEYREKYRKYLGKVGARFIGNKIEDFHCFILNPQNHYEQQKIDDILKITCLSSEELHNYLDERDGYDLFSIWHISKLMVYDEPRELSEFRPIVCKYNYDNECIYKMNCKHQQDTSAWGYKTFECARKITRPPQAWGYVESNVKEAKTKNKPTDEQIIKAFEACTNGFCLDIYCPYVSKNDSDRCDRNSMHKDILDIIKSREQKIFELENRLKECENGYEGTLYLESCKLHDAEKKIKELTEENERLKAVNTRKEYT